MKKNSKIFPNDWINIHPYNSMQPSDPYFIELANKLYEKAVIDELPEKYKKKICIYISAYLEDIISGLGLWDAFRSENRRLYGKNLPFYDENEYFDGEPNFSDLCFIIWNTWQKAPYEHAFVNPSDKRIKKQAEAIYETICKAYEDAPENDCLKNFFDSFKDEKDADHKLGWLFGHNYLTEPSMEPYIDRVTPSDKFIIPTGPLALFLHEWIDILTENEEWKNVKKLYVSQPAIPASMSERNKDTFSKFTDYTNGYHLAYLNGYDSLRSFLVNVLKWKDDDNHTLPQMKAHNNFILMVNQEKGLLLAKDICEFIADANNPFYNKDKAEKNSFRLLTEETLCPPDLLTYCINNKMLPDLTIPNTDEKNMAVENADFIARHSLLYYYRGD